MQILNGNLVGKVLGKYRLEALIGTGGMSAVYRAEQLPLARRVAVKVLSPDVMSDSDLQEEFLIRFQREASLIARLEHLNIMPIYDYGKQGGIVYLVMPYLAGGTLRDVLTQRGALPLQEALTYIEQAAAALDYAHAHGIIHRDLKPSNFLLHPDGRLVLADFGIARMMQGNGNARGMTLTSTDVLLGTPEYMAPEMIRGEQVDRRTDIYELGIVLFQILSGTVPFRGDPHLAILMKHLQEPIPLLHYSNPAVPPAVDAVIQKATAKNREDRYASAGALAQGLKAAINTATYRVAEERHYAPIILAPYSPPSDRSAPTQADSAHIPTMPGVVGTPGPQVRRVASTRTRLTWLTWIAVIVVLMLTLGGIFVGRTKDPSRPPGLLVVPESTPTSVGGGQVGGIPCPGATSIQNVDGTAYVYWRVEQPVTKGKALVLSLRGGTSQVVDLFQSQGDLDGYISQHDAKGLPLYQQHLYPGPSILVLKQVNQDAYDLIVLHGNAQGGNPNYDCRVVGNDQIDQVIQQLSSLYKELQGVQPLKFSDHPYTLLADQTFA
jgi:serine/threonine protein kinase